MSEGIGRGSWLYRIIRNLLCIFCRLVLRLEVRGAENIPAEGSCVLAANHTSFLDPPMVGCAAKERDRAVRFMARDSLYKSLFGSFLRRVHTIPISRDKGDVSALRTAIKAIKGGNLVALFPEGTRSRDGEIQTAKGGVAFLVAKAKVPVVPIYIEGSFRALPKGAVFIRPHKVRMNVGPPIPPSDLKSSSKGSEGYREIGEHIMKEIAKLRPAEGDGNR